MLSKLWYVQYKSEFLSIGVVKCILIWEVRVNSET